MRRVRRLLRAILATAVEDELIPRNPCVLKGASVERADERPVASLTDLAASASAVALRYRAMLLLATWAGLRFGELAGLTRADVDLAARTVHVWRQVQELGDGRLVTGPPKPMPGAGPSQSHRHQAPRKCGLMDDSVSTPALRDKHHCYRYHPHYSNQGGVPVETSPFVGVGVSDLMHAVRAEVDRIFKETKGDNLATMKVLTTRLRELDLVTDTEVGTLNRMSEIAVEAGAGKRNAGAAYLESIDLYNSLVVTGNASHVALIIGSSAVGSYVPTADPDGSGAVVYSKSGGFWTGWGAAAGAVIGSAIPGVGAGLGAAIGGLIGQAVDHCTDRS